MELQRAFFHYTVWEDYKSGMYSDFDKETEYKLVTQAILCLKNPELAMIMVTVNWPKSAAENLSNKQQNRKAWLGQAACCLIYGSPEHCTREAWKLLTNEERNLANQIAQKTIEQWERRYLKLTYSKQQKKG